MMLKKPYVAKWLSLVFYVALLQVLPFTLQAQNRWPVKSIRLSKELKQVPVSYSSVMVFRDSTNKMSIEQIVNAHREGRFADNNQQMIRNTKLGQTYWLYSRVMPVRQADNPTRNWVLEYYDSSIEKITLYFYRNGKIVDSVCSGTTLNHKTGRRYEHKNITFRIPDFEGPNSVIEIYAKFQSSKSIFMYGVFRPIEVFVNYALREYYYLGAYYGMLIAILFFNIFFYLTVKNKSYLFLGLYVIFNLFYSLSNDGIGFHLFWPNIPQFNNHLLEISLLLMTGFISAYALSFFGTKYAKGNIVKMLYGGLALKTILFFLGFICSPLRSILYADILVFIILYIIAISAWKQGFKPGGYFTIGFSFLFLGFIISNLTNKGFMGISLPNNIFTVYSVNFGTLIQLALLSFSVAESVRLTIKENERSRALVIAELEEKNQLRAQLNYELETLVKKRSGEIEKQAEHINNLYNEITSNIAVARLIQQSVLPDTDIFKHHFADSFLLYLPRDIVSGDFYWTREDAKHIWIASADCTGHGVSGAFMSLIGTNVLNSVFESHSDLNPGEFLEKAHQRLLHAIKRGMGDTVIKEGMDISLVKFAKKSSTFEFAGAFSQIIKVGDEEIETLKGDRVSLGFPRIKLNRVPIDHSNYHEIKANTFETHKVNVNSGDWLFMFSDGFPDQLGGITGEDKYKYPRFRNLLKQAKGKNGEVIKLLIEKELEMWKNNWPQTDDILILGLKF